MEKNEINNKAIEKNDLAFKRRHSYDSDTICVGKKTFHVTSVFPLKEENENAESASDKIRMLLRMQKK